MRSEPPAIGGHGELGETARECLRMLVDVASAFTEAGVRYRLIGGWCAAGGTADPLVETEVRVTMQRLLRALGGET